MTKLDMQGTGAHIHSPRDDLASTIMVHELILAKQNLEYRLAKSYFVEIPFDLPFRNVPFARELRNNRSTFSTARETKQSFQSQL